MPCVVALIVLSIMGIFSATNRSLAKEAMDCVLRRVTLRPCTTGFDEKIKSKILGSVITRSEAAARVINRNFELMSWIFFLVFLASGVYSMRSIYLFYVTGSCNGLNSSALCMFDPTGQNNQVSAVSSGCYVNPPTESDLSLSTADFSSFAALNPGSTEKITFIGCYACDYTREVYPLIRQLASKYHVSLTYADFPTKEKSDYLSRAGYCANQQDPELFWKLNDALFAADKASLDDYAAVQKLIADAGLNTGKMNACIADPATETAVQEQFLQVKKTKFYGTPTIFIDGTPFVGPKPYRVYAIKLKGLLYWLY